MKILFFCRAYRLFTNVLRLLSVLEDAFRLLLCDNNEIVDVVVRMELPEVL